MKNSSKELFEFRLETMQKDLQTIKDSVIAFANTLPELRGSIQNSGIEINSLRGKLNDLDDTVSDIENYIISLKTVVSFGKWIIGAIGLSNIILFIISLAK